MANIVPISAEQFANKRWQRLKTMHFAANDITVPITAQEAARAILSMPIGFVRTPNSYNLVALLGLESEKNLMIDAAGKWRGGYLPQYYLCRPFLIRKSTDDKLVLCIDEDDELITSIDDLDAEKFYADGAPTTVVSEIASFLTKRVYHFEATTQMCVLLEQHKLIKPWPIKANTKRGELQIEAMYCIDEERLNKLSGTALKELRNSDALLLAYAQLFSMLNIHLLVDQTNGEDSVDYTAGNQGPEISFEGPDAGGTISFENL